MVQVLPGFDLGGMIGKSLGEGAGQALSSQADRYRMLNALDSLSSLGKPIEQKDEQGNIQSRQPTFAENLQTLVRSGAGIPGWMNVVETLAPSMMKQAQGQAAIRSGVSASPQRQQQTQQSQITSEQIGAQEEPTNLDRISNLRDNVTQVVQTSEQIPLSIMSDLPKFAESKPAYEVPTTEQLNESIQQYVDAGATPDDAFKKVQQDVKLGVQRYESQMDKWKQDISEFQQERGLESEQRAFVENKSKDFLRQVGITTEDREVPQYYTDIAYNKFQEEKSKNPKASDQSIWSSARKKLGQIVELEAQGAIKGKPNLISPRDTKGAINNTKNWAQSYLKEVGEHPEAVDKARSILMNQGWSRHMAHEFTSEESKPLRAVLDKMPKIQIPTAKPISSPTALKREAERQESENKKINEKIDSLIPDLARSITDKDSIFLLRNNLVRDKNIPERRANEIIEKAIKMKGGLPTHQSKEIPLLQEDPNKDIWRIFKDFMFPGEKK